MIIETLAALIGLAASTGTFLGGFDTLASDARAVEMPAEPPDAGRAAPDPLVTPFIRPAPNAGPAAVSLPESQKVNWAGILTQELRFLAIEHGFRLATEPGTRDGGFGVGKSYWNSVFNLHDGRTAIPFTSTMSAIP